MRTTILLSILLVLSFSCFSQEKKDDIEISLLTCSGGQQLYSTFGHSAIRIVDTRNNKEDIVFDYGTFNFNTPFFIWRFLNGNLEYSLSQRKFEDFVELYKAEGRSVIEEKLNLQEFEKFELYNTLLLNFLPENRFYEYNFLYDNCSTRIRDLLEQLVQNRGWKQKNKLSDQSFRDNIHLYLTEKPWIKLGIDIMLGTQVDEKISSFDQMFLPNKLSQHLGTSLLRDSTKLLTPSIIVSTEISTPKGLFDYIKPFYLFSIILVVVMALAFWRPRITNKILRLAYFFIGILGCFLLFIWFGTSLPGARTNWNVLWANPLYLLFLFKNTKPYRNICLISTLVLNFLILIFWNFIPQKLNPSITLICSIMIFLSLSKFIYHKLRRFVHLEITPFNNEK